MKGCSQNSPWWFLSFDRTIRIIFIFSMSCWHCLLGLVEDLVVFPNVLMVHGNDSCSADECSRHCLPVC